MKKIKVSIIGPGLDPVVHTAKAGLIAKIVAGIIGVAVVGGGVTLVTRIWDPLWNPFRPKPEEVIEEMFTKMKEAETIHIKGIVQFGTIGEKLGQETQISINFSGDSDFADPENYKLARDFEMDISLDGKKFSLAGEARIIRETIFIKFTTIPFLPIPGIDLTKVKNQWIRIDQEVLESLGGVSGVYYLGQQKEVQEMLKEIMKKWLKILREKKPYHVKEELKDEKIEGKKAYHYMVDVDREKSKEAVSEMMKVYVEETMKILSWYGMLLPKEEISRQAEEISKEVSESVDKLLKKIGGLPTEMWIGKKDLLLYKIKIDKEIDTSKFKKGAKGKTTISIDIEFSNFNEPVEIEAPESFKSLKEILAPAQRKAANAGIMANMSQMRSVAELIWFDEGDGYANVSCQHTYIKAICEDIKRYAGMEPVIHSSKDDYCAYVKLPIGEEVPAEYYCIDNSGTRVETNIKPEQRSYCDGKTFVCPPG